MFKDKALLPVVLLSLTLTALASGCGGGAGGGTEPPEEVEDPVTQPKELFSIKPDNAELIAEPVLEFVEFIDHMVFTDFIGIANYIDDDDICTTGRAISAPARDASNAVIPGTWRYTFEDCLIEQPAAPPLTIYLEKRYIQPKVRLNGNIYFSDNTSPTDEEKAVLSSDKRSDRIITIEYDNLEYEVVGGSNRWRVTNGTTLSGFQDRLFAFGDTLSNINILNLDSLVTYRAANLYRGYAKVNAAAAEKLVPAQFPRGTIYYNETEYVTAFTPTPIQLATSPEEADILIRGADGALLKITEAHPNMLGGFIYTGIYTHVLLELDNDGKPGVDREAFIPKKVLGTNRHADGGNKAPVVKYNIINAKSIARGDGTYRQGEATNLQKATVNDPDYDFVTYSAKFIGWPGIGTPEDSRCNDGEYWGEIAAEQQDWDPADRTYCAIDMSNPANIKIRSYFPGDFVFRLTTSDGVETVSEDVVIHIRQNPPVVKSDSELMAKLSRGETLNYTEGEDVALQIEMDPSFDGDSINFSIVSGPTGASISKNPDGSSATLTWTASANFFGALVPQLITVRVSNDDTATDIKVPLNVAATTPVVPKFIPRLNVPARSQGVTALDTDGDGRDELVLTNAHEFLYNIGYSGGFNTDWANHFALSNSNVLAALPFSPANGAIHYAVLTPDDLLVVDGESGKVLARRSNNITEFDRAPKFATGETNFHIAVADFDPAADNGLEIVVSELLSAGDYEIVIYNQSLQKLWSSEKDSKSGRFIVANVDADDKLEIIDTSGYVYDIDTLRNYRDAGLQWDYAGFVDPKGFGSFVMAADFDGDGNKDLVAINNGQLESYDVQNQLPLATSSFSFGQPIVTFLVRDIDGDNNDEILLVTKDNLIRAIDINGNQPTTLWQHSINTMVRDIVVGDMDGDNVEELVVVSTPRADGYPIFALYDMQDQSLLASSGLQTLPTGDFSTVATDAIADATYFQGFFGDGFESNLKVARVEKDGQLTLGARNFPLSGLGTSLFANAVDWDGDSDADIVFTGRGPDVNLSPLLAIIGLDLGTDLFAPSGQYAVYDFDSDVNLWSSDALGGLFTFPIVAGFGDVNNDNENEVIGVTLNTISVVPVPGLSLSYDLTVNKVFGTGTTSNTSIGLAEDLDGIIGFTTIKILSEDLDMAIYDPKPGACANNPTPLPITQTELLYLDPLKLDVYRYNNTLDPNANCKAVRELKKVKSIATPAAVDMAVVDLDNDGQKEVIVVTAPFLNNAFKDTHDVLIISSELKVINSFAIKGSIQTLDTYVDKNGNTNLLIGTYDKLGDQGIHVSSVNPMSGYEAWRSPALNGNKVVAAEVVRDINDVEQLRIVTNSSIFITQ